MVINLKLIRTCKLLKGALKLFLDILLAGSFDQFFFYELHRYGIAQRFQDVLGLLNDMAACPVL